MANRTVSVTGTASGTPGTNGATYVTLNAALAGEVAAAPNLVADTCILTIECYASAAPDTTPAVTGSGWTVSSSYYINIVAPTGDRHDGKWNTAKYRMEVTGNVDALTLQEDYTRVTGLQIKSTSSANGDGMKSIVFDAQNCYVDKTIVWVSSSHTGCGITSFRGNGTGTVRNTVLFASGTGIASASWAYGFYPLADISLYNCTAYGYKSNFRSIGGTIVLKNCVSQSSSVEGYSISTSTGSDYNLSDRADAVGTTVYNSKTLTFVNAGSGDFHLAAGDTDAIDKGTSLSGTFTDDIDGVTRSGTWDLGADEYVAAGATFVPQVIMVL